MKPFSWLQSVTDQLELMRWKVIDYRFSSAFSSWVLTIKRNQHSLRFLWDGKDQVLIVQKPGNNPEEWIDVSRQDQGQFDPEHIEGLILAKVKQLN